MVTDSFWALFSSSSARSSAVESAPPETATIIGESETGSFSLRHSANSSRGKLFNLATDRFLVLIYGDFQIPRDQSQLEGERRANNRDNLLKQSTCFSFRSFNTSLQIKRTKRGTVWCELKSKSGLMSGCLDPPFFVSLVAVFG